MSPTPLPVRDAIEATVLARQAGANPRHVRRESLGEGAERWTLERAGRSAWQQDFEIGDGSGPFVQVDASAVREMGWSLVASVPARADLLGAAYLVEVGQTLSEAEAMLSAAGEDTTELQALVARMRLAAQICRPFPMERMAVPPGKLALSLPQRDALPKPPADRTSYDALLEGEWQLVTDDPDKRLLRHVEGAMLLLKIGENSKVEDHQLYEGPDALMTWAVNGFTLTPETGGRLLEGVQVGASLNDAIQSLKSNLVGNMNVLASIAAGGQRVLHFLLIDEEGERRRAAVLALLVSAQKQVMGCQLLQGPPGFDQMMRVLERVSLENSKDETLRQLAKREAISDEARLAVAPFLSPSADHRSLTDAFKPRPGDAAKVFLPELASAIEAALERVWDKGVTIRPAGGQTEVSARVAQKQDFEEQAAHTAPFAQAYFALAAYLQPDRMWASWTFHESGKEKGTRYDGLVWIDDHWAWFPKPWRLLPRH